MARAIAAAKAKSIARTGELDSSSPLAPQNDMERAAHQEDIQKRWEAGIGASFLGAVRTLLWKDLVTEWRRRELVASLVVFSLLVLLVFDFAFDLRSADVPAAAPGILWVTFIFSGVLSLNRAFAV